jgi:hypothetical protein
LGDFFNDPSDDGIVESPTFLVPAVSRPSR